MFVIFFFGIFAYFFWKTFSQPSRSGTREIFEFYLSANEILRDDERRWFGFEVQEVISRGERILQLMNGRAAARLFHARRTLSIASAITNPPSIIFHTSSKTKTPTKRTYVYSTPELKNYVRILRKIEREPAEAPQTSAAIRALERARRNRGKTILENSREGLLMLNGKKQQRCCEQKKPD